MSNILNSVRKGWHIFNHRLQTQGIRTTLLWIYARGIPKLTGIPIIKYNQVTPQIFVGAQYRQAGKRKLQQLGITGDVNLRTEFDDAAHGLALEHYCHLPTVDDDAPTMAHLQKGVVFIQQVLNNGGKVYIHCAGGVGRAPTMAAAYLISRGHTLDESIALIQRVRPFIKIMPVQMEQLKRFAAMHTPNT